VPNRLKAQTSMSYFFLLLQVIMEFEKAKQILNTESEKKYTDQEIIEIMQMLEVFASVWVNNLLKSSKNEKCNSLC
jgi:hypothetical protein